MKTQLALLGGPKIRTKSFDSLPRIGDEEKKSVQQVLDSGLLSGFTASPAESFLGGPKVKALESSFADYFDRDHAVSMNSATACLHAALAALDIATGDEVIVTSYTMSATAASILMQNAVPVFADIQISNLCLDPQDVRRKITARTKAIIVVHLFGFTANMDGLMAIAHEHGLKVIEDCAQAPGAEISGRKVGTFGDIGVFSLNQHKIITTGEGGVAITNNPDLAYRMQLIRNHGEVIVENLPADEAPNLIGWNYRMTEVEAAIGISQFNRLETLTDHRIRLAEYLSSRLDDFDGITCPKPPKNNRYVYFAYPIRFSAKKTCLTRELLAKALRAEGIPCGTGYVRPIYLQPVYQNMLKGPQGFPLKCGCYQKTLNYHKGLCPIAERMHSEELLVLPELRWPYNETDMDDIVRAFEKIFSYQNELINEVAYDSERG